MQNYELEQVIISQAKEICQLKSLNQSYVDRIQELSEENHEKSKGIKESKEAMGIKSKKISGSLADTLRESFNEL